MRKNNPPAMQWTGRRTTQPRPAPQQSVGTLVKYFHRPMGKVPIRLPTYPGLQRTSILSFFVPTSLNITSASTVRLGFYPQPAFPLWAELPCTAETYFGSWLMTAASGGSTGVGTPGKLGGWAVGTSANTSLNVPIPAITGGLVPPCQYLVTGVDTGCSSTPFIYVPPGFNAYSMFLFGLAIGTTAASVGTGWEIWTAPGSTTTLGVNSTFSVANATGAMVATPLIAAAANTGGVWIRPTVVNASVTFGQAAVGLVITSGTATYTASASTNGSVAITATAASNSYMPLMVPADFAISTIPWSDTRIVAGELRIQNVTSMINRGGSFTAARIVPEDTPITGWTAALVTAANPRDKLFAPADMAMTTFLMPGSDISNFYDCTYSATVGANGTVARLPVMSLNNPQPFQAFVITVPAAQTFALQPELHMEFRNQRSLFPLGFSDVHVDAMNRAAIILAQMPPFHSGLERPERPELPQKARARQRARGPQPRKRRNRRARTDQQPHVQTQQPKKKGGLTLYLEARGKGAQAGPQPQRKP